MWKFSPDCGYCDDNSAASQNYETNSLRENPLSSFRDPKPQHVPNPISLQEADLAHLVYENLNLDALEKKTNLQLLVKYINNMTTQPGKCELYCYEMDYSLYTHTVY
jgi:hypothetical protein